MDNEDERGLSDVEDEAFGSESNPSSPSKPPPPPDEKENKKVQAFSEGQAGRRRSGVSAASVTEDDMQNFQAPVHPKSAEETAKIKEIISAKPALQVLFGHLEGAALEKVVGAMFMKRCSVGDVVI